MGRTKNAAEKSFDPTDPVGNNLRVIHGKFADSKFLWIVQKGVLLNPEQVRKLKQDAEAATDPNVKQSLVGAARFLEEEITDFTSTFGAMAAQAAMDKHSVFFQEVAALIDRLGAGQGTVIHQTQNLLQSNHSMLKSELRRLPTSGELKERSKIKDEGQFRRTWKELSLKFTAAKLISGIQVRARRIQSPRGNPFVEISALRESLKNLPSAKDLVADSRDKFVIFCESAEVQFEPLKSLAAHHAFFHRDIGRLPSPQELIDDLPDYCRDQLACGTTTALRKICKTHGLRLISGKS